jgi:hypothetical protein
MERDYQEMRDTQVGRTPAEHRKVKPGKMTHRALTQDTQRMSDQSLSRAIGSLRRLVPSPELSESLRVMASRERARLLQGRQMPFSDRARLFVDNLMRPLALPFAGGIFSAVVLFGMWVIPTYPLRGSITGDVPTGLSTQAAIQQTGPVDVSGDAVVDVTVEPLADGTGRMLDYHIVSGNVPDDQALRRSSESFLIFTVFKPATALGQPVVGKIRLSLQSSQIDVKG